VIKQLSLKSEFSRNVLTLMTGTTIAQAIPIAISPILTRIYSPEDFGFFALYMSLLLVLSSIATMKYELAINLPLKDEDAYVVLFLSIVIALVVSVILFLVMLFYSRPIALLLGNEAIRPWLYLLPFSILLAGIINSLNYWFNRKKAFKTLAISRVAQTSSASVTQLSLGVFLTNAGLLVGSIVGQLTSVLLLVNIFSRQRNPLFNKHIFLENILEKLALFKKFPKYQVPSTFVESSSAQMPIFLLGAFFAPSVVGFYSLSQKVVRLPITVVASSIGEVFRQEASRGFAESGDVRGVFKDTLIKLSLISIVPFSIFALFSPELFAFVFGNDWIIAGEYAQVMTPLFWLSFVVGPLSVMFIIAEKQEYDLVIQITLLVSSVSSLLIGFYYFQSAYMSIVLLSITYSIKYFIELFLSYRFCLKGGNGL
jgi:O-antigen/teichoic acid export membrane protein